MKKYILFVLCFIVQALVAQEYTIVPMTQELAPQALQVFLHAIVELQVIPSQNVEQLEIMLQQNGETKDFEAIDMVYTQNRGIFLALVSDGKVLGMGAIKKWSDDICEVKRMFFAPQARGKGLGARMLSTLLDHARALGYTIARLDTYNPTTQVHAVALYKKFGFYEIERYNNSQAKLYMEKVL